MRMVRDLKSSAKIIRGFPDTLKGSEGERGGVGSDFESNTKGQREAGRELSRHAYVASPHPTPPDPARLSFEFGNSENTMRMGPAARL